MGWRTEGWKKNLGMRVKLGNPVQWKGAPECNTLLLNSYAGPGDSTRHDAAWRL